MALLSIRCNLFRCGIELERCFFPVLHGTPMDKHGQRRPGWWLAIDTAIQLVAIGRMALGLCAHDQRAIEPRLCHPMCVLVIWELVVLQLNECEALRLSHALMLRHFDSC